jgi:hypothetical protein
LKWPQRKKILKEKIYIASAFTTDLEIMETRKYFQKASEKGIIEGIV